ncbi:MAG: 5'-methylthioadenosine/adenosylhomocysteine nucleosidase [Lachnospiraceae bacterium]
MIGFIGAMEEEVEQLVDAMTDKKKTERASLTFYQGNLGGREVVVVRAGIGKVNAAICTQMLIDFFNVEAVINTGIAGSLNADINIGDIVLSSDVLQHDVDATNFGYEPGQIPRMDTLAFKADERLIEVAKTASGEVLCDVGVFVGRVVSGDQFISNKAVKDDIVRKFGGLATEMEGAAIGQAAYVNGVPFLVIRAISDKADDSASVDYPTFEKQAIANMVKLTKKFIEMI